MKFETHNDVSVSINGTGLQGYIKVDYDVLRRAFGEPNDGDAYKIDAQWVLRFEDGMVATIYNYKTGRNYAGSRGGGTPTNRIVDWHIGGKNPEVVERVKGIIAKWQEEGR
jgi:hypothetical protein